MRENISAASLNDDGRHYSSDRAIIRIAVAGGLNAVCAGADGEEGPSLVLRLTMSLGGGGGNDASVLVSPRDLMMAGLDEGEMPDSVQCLLDGRADSLELAPQPSLQIRRIAEEIRASPYAGAARALYIQGKLLELLALSLAQAVTGAGENEVLRNERRWVMEARAVLMADLADPPALEELARRIGTSPRKMNAAFRRFCGMTAFGWLADWRLTHARDLLIENHVPVKEIASTLGYGHVNNFINAFSRKFGISPARFRGQAIERPGTC
ncbi:MAG: helix-turn-helix transcriptional regulator [Magnetospirillum sp.]|nr:helix-turn-helix transcriptional regulator [Magnetospirillum sp.]